MLIRFSYVSVLLTVTLVSACAVPSHSIIEAKENETSDKEKLTGHHVKDCQTQERDLTLEWSKRQYWCSSKGRVAEYQRINDLIVTDVVDNSGMDLKQYLNELNSEAATLIPEDMGLANHQPEPLVVDESVSGVSSESQEIDISVESDEGSTSRVDEIADNDAKYIYFAEKIRVLGPQGRKKALSMIDVIKDLDTVRIRGGIEQGEFLVQSKVYLESVSVGRALAVKWLWKENGVDVSNVTILHYDPVRSDVRAVEVMLDV